MRALLATTLSALALLAAGCGHGRAAADAALPLDADLRRHLAAVGRETPVDVLVGLAADAPGDARGALEAAGLAVRSVAGGVAVAQGVPAAVRRAAALPFVERVERSQDRPPLSSPRR